MYKARPVIIAYDISSNRARSRVRKILREWNLCNQKSVYECRLKSHQAEELYIQLCSEMDLGTDNLVMAWIKPEQEILYLGLGKDTSLNKQLFYL